MTSPSFVKVLQGVISEEGGTAIFEAHVEGNPLPEIRWYRDGDDVTNSHNYDVVRAADGRTTLTINEVFDEDAGQFTCKATNEHGEASSKAELVVQAASVPPDFSQKLNNVEANPGDHVQFSVKTIGVPKPQVKWYREGAEIENSNDFQLQFTGNVSSLTIPAACEENSGQITVTASNSIGKATSTARLVVRKDEYNRKFLANSSNFRSTPKSSATISRVSLPQHEMVLKKYNNLKLGQGRHPYMKPGYLEEVIKKLEERQKTWGELAEELSTTPSSPESGNSKKSLENSEPLKLHGKCSNHIVTNSISSLKNHVITNSHDSLASPSSMSSSAKKSVDKQLTSFTAIVQKDFAVFAPFIKCDTTEFEVKEGEMSLFHCNISGNPVPHVTWFREGARIESSPDFEIDFSGKVATLLIRDTFADDAGSFTCTASNQAGTASVTFILKVLRIPTELKRENRPASASELDLSMTDYEGTEAELDFVSGVSEAEMTDTEMFKPVVGRRLIKTKSGESDNDSTGTIEAKNNEMATKIMFATGTQPKFERFPPKQIKLVEGGSIRLDCVISGKPPPLVTWSHKGVMVKNGYRFKIIEDKENGVYSLLIGMMFAEDVGEYTVTATNQFGFISGSMYFVPEEHYKQMQDSANGEIPPDFLPQDGSEEIQASAELRQIEMKNFKPSVTPDVQLSDDMRSTGVGSMNFRQDFIKSPESSWSAPREHYEDLPTDQDKFFKPKFLIIPESRECKEGETIRIDCKVNGRPIPEVVFLHDDSPRVEDSRHRVVVKENGVHSLIISPSRPEDSGEYTILADSEAGKARCTMQLTVYAQEDIERPRILEKPQSVFVKEGDTVRLEVFAIGHPTPEIAWLKDNMLLTDDKCPDLRIEGVDGHGLLTIERANKGFHDAWYTAIAINKGGRDLTRCKVSVAKSGDEPKSERKLYVPKVQKTPAEMKPLLDRADKRKNEDIDEADMYRDTTMQKPRFKKKLVTKKQKILGAVHFECFIAPVGDPHMKVEWLLEGKPLECANRIKESFEFGLAVLHITSVFPRDTGVITCRATNAHGQVQNSCALIVKEEKGLVDASQLNDAVMLERIQNTEKHRQDMSLIHDSFLNDVEEVECPPSVVLPLEPVRVQEGEPARFRCRVVGNPIPKVSWYLNELSIRPSKRFRIWHDGIDYLEVTSTRSYDHGFVRLVAENALGREEVKTTIEIFQGQDIRSVLHRGTSNAGRKADDSFLRQYRNTRNFEDNLREGNNKGKRMVQLREVKKPVSGLKNKKNVEREDELQRKFSQISEEEHVLKAYEANKKKANGKENPLNVQQHLRNLTLPVGQDASFEVRFQAESDAEVTWYRNEEELSDSSSVDILSPEIGVSQLLLLKVNKDDSGTISVRIANSTGQAAHSQCFLLVQEISANVYFSEPLSDILAKENDKSIIFECSLSRQVDRAASWRYQADEGKPAATLENSDKYQFLSEGTRHVLRVCGVKLSDAGEYSCWIDSPDETINTSARLDVKAIAKTIEILLSDQIAPEGSSTRFSATVSHVDVTGKWMKDGVELEESEKFTFGNVGSKRDLTIYDCRPDDEGIYEFIYEGSSTKAVLSVQAMHVSILKKPQSLEVFGGESAKFEVQLSRHDALGVWKFNGEKVMPSDRVLISSNLAIHSLTIQNCNSGDEGDYSFTVASSTATAHLKVKDVTITDPLQDLDVVETTDALLQCAVSDASYRSGKWYRDGDALPQHDPKFVIKSKHCTQLLIIKSVGESDAGSYAYVAGSESVSEADLSVTPIEIIQAAGDVTAFESTTARFDVHLSHDGANGTWYKNGELLQPSQYRSTTKSENVHSLVIDSLACEDQAKYEFRVASKSCIAVLTVKEIEFTQKLSDLIISESKTAVFECRTCREEVRGKWFKEGFALEETNEPRYQINNDGPCHRLVVSNVTTKDNGLYVYQIASSSTSAWLNVKPIKFSKGLRNTTASEGSDVSFVVEVANDNVDSVIWEKNGSALSGDDAKFLMTSTGFAFTLTIKTVSKRDEAAYTCRAGSAKTTARLFVEEVKHGRKSAGVSSHKHSSNSGTKTWTTSQTTHVTSSRSSTQVYEDVPNNHTENVSDKLSARNDVRMKKQSTSENAIESVRIVKKLGNVSITETQTATLECQLSHFYLKSEDCKWTKSGRAITPDERMVVTADRNIHRLVISACDVNDAGTYEFQCKNDKCSAQLRVKGLKFVKKLPKLTKALRNKVMVLECELDSANIFGQWLKDGKSLKLHESHVNKYDMTSREKTHTLTINELTSSDAGSYTFVAGSAKTTTTLIVKEPTVKILQFSKKVEVSEGKQALLKVEVNQSNMTGKWFKNGNVVNFANEKRFNYKIDDFSHQLLVDNVSVADSGHYLFQAEDCQSTTVLQVQGCSGAMPVPESTQFARPSIIEPLEDFCAQEGDRAQFFCKISGPGIKTVWKKNGKKIEPSQYFKITSQSNEHRLEIPQIFSEDEGIYQIIARNEHGVVSCSARLEFGTVNPPSVIEPLQPAHVIEGSAVKMDCVVDGIQLKTRWYVGDDDVTDNPRYKWKLDTKSGLCFLIIPECRARDAGEIRCHVSNVAGEVVCSTDLRVTEVRKSKRKSKGDLLSIDYSSADNSNQLQVRSKTTGREFTIHRSDVNRLVGNYISQSDVDPTLTDTPVLSKAKPVPKTDLEEDYISPAFTRKPKLQSALTEETARFKCSFVASPRPKVFWYHGDTEIDKNCDRLVMTLERDMLSYQASLEIHDCQLSDAGIYRVELQNKEGTAQAKASLVVTKRSAVEGLEAMPSVLYCPGLTTLKNYHSETDLRKTGVRFTKDFENTPSECGSAPGGIITPRRPFSPRRYYERRNKESRSSSPPDTNVADNAPKSGRESRVSRCSDFEQSFSSISSLSSCSLTSPSRLSRSFENDDRSISFSDALSRSLTTSDQRKLNSLRSVGADNGILASVLKARSNQTLSELENTGMKSFDEQYVSTFSGVRSQHGDQNFETNSPRKVVRTKRIPPIFISALPKDAIDLNEGEELKLSCIIDGSPFPKVAWMKDAENLDNFPNFNFEHVNLNVTGDKGWRIMMSVRSVTLDHSGTYTVTAYNTHGDISSDIRVRVHNRSDELS